jgi:hypothetical protein
MDARAAPTSERLKRAEGLVTQAAEAGAQLVALPELFGTGYDYAESNYRRAERPSGATITWMQETAARLNVHLGGTLLLLDRDEVYNALLLFAPDGRMWRYDKLYPWGWERAYFGRGRGITVAETDLGRIGMMICWDVGHPALWRRYAGRVDLMLICSCPPDATNGSYRLPNGDQLTMGQLGPVVSSVEDTGRLAFGKMIDEQVAWLRVPAIHSTASGKLRLNLLHGTALVLFLLPQAPWLVRYLTQSDRMQLSCGVVPGCKVLEATGQRLVELAQGQGETVVVAEISLAETPPRPGGPQPPSRLPWAAYLLSDVFLPALCIPGYRRGLRRTWGPDMAPVDAATRRWRGTLGLVSLVSLALGWLLGRRGRKG